MLVTSMKSSRKPTKEYAEKSSRALGAFLEAMTAGRARAKRIGLRKKPILSSTYATGNPPTCATVEPALVVNVSPLKALVTPPHTATVVVLIIRFTHATDEGVAGLR